jgi:L-aminopeptidase/D-esterase-like protein
MSNDIRILATDAMLTQMRAVFVIQMERYKLAGSDVIESIEWKFDGDNIFTLIANDYFEWIVTGRRPRAKKVPIEALLKWIKKNNLIPKGKMTVNALAFAIQNSIYKSGIKAKPFEVPATLEAMDILSQHLANDLAAQIEDEITKIMTFEINLTI